MGKRVRALEEQPSLDEDVEAAWTCFTDLDRERDSGFAGPHAIRLSEIVAWMDLHCMSGDEVRADFYRLVQAADGEALKVARENSEKDADDKGKGKK